MMMLIVIIKSFWADKQRKENEDKVRPAVEKYVVDTYGKNADIEMKWVAIISTASKPQ